MIIFLDKKIAGAVTIIAIIFALTLVSSDAIAATRVDRVQVCENGVIPTMNISWSVWTDYHSFTNTPTRVELRRILYDGTNWSSNQYSNFEVLASYDWDSSVDGANNPGGVYGSGRSYSDTTVVNGSEYMYRIVMFDADGTGKVMNYWRDRIKCGRSVAVSTTPGAPWSISGGNVSNGSQTGSGTAYVESGGSYTISFTNPTGYAMAGTYPRIRDVNTWTETHGSYSFSGDGDKTVQAVFTNSPAAPQTTLLCEKKKSPQMVINWRAVDGADGYKINAISNINTVHDVGNVTSGTFNVAKDQSYRHSITPYDSSGSNMRTSAVSSSVKADCNAVLSVTSNKASSGTWTIDSEGKLLQNESGEANVSYSLRGSTVWGTSLYVYYYANPGYTCEGCSWGGNSLGNWKSGGWNWFRTGGSYASGVEWSSIPNPAISTSSSCSGGANPVVGISWYPEKGMGINPVLTRGDGAVIATQNHYEGSGSSSYIYKGTASDEVSPGTYTYTLDYNNGSEPSSTQHTVPACEESLTDATLSINTNLSSAKWSMTKDSSVVVNGKKGNSTDVYAISGATDDFVLTTESVDGYSYMVTNNKDENGSRMSGVSAGDSYGFTIVYTRNPGISITANPESVASGGKTKLEWSGSDVENCVASGGWSGSKSTTGTSWVMNIDSDSAFSITCDSRSNESTVSDIAHVSVRKEGGGDSYQCNNRIDDDGDTFIDYPEDSGCESETDDSESSDGGESEVENAPVISFRASPSRVVKGGSTKLIWNNKNVSECRALGGPWTGVFSGPRAISGNTLSSSITKNPTRFTIECDGVGVEALVRVSNTTVTFVEPYFQIQIIGISKIEGYSGTSTPVVVRVSPVNGYNKDIKLEVIANENLLDSKNILSKSILSPAEYSMGSSFLVHVPNITRSGTYPIMIRGEGLGGGYVDISNVNLIVDNPGSRSIDEF